jgi:WD40 repeat protein
LVGVTALLAACGSAPRPAKDGPRLVAERTGVVADAGAPAREAAFSADGRWLVTTSAAGAAVLRSFPSLKEARRFTHAGGATAAVFAPDGRWLAVAGYDGGIDLWDPASGQLLRRLRGAAGTVWSVAVSPDGGTLAAAGEDKKIRLWNVADGRLVRTIAGHDRIIWEVRFSPDGRRLASGSFDQTARLWDVATGRQLGVLREHKQAVVGLAWSADGQKLATGGDDATIFLRRGSDGAPERRIDVGNHVYKLAFSPDGRWLANAGRARGGLGTLLHQVGAAGGDTDTVRLWRVADGRLVAGLKLADDVLYTAFSPDGRWLVTSGEDGKVTVWRLQPR